MGRRKEEKDETVTRNPVRAGSNVPENRAEILKRIDEAVAEIRKKFGKEAIGRLGEYEQVVGTFPTGLPNLDEIIGLPGKPDGWSGFPLAKLVQITGAESVGKSTLVNYLAAQAQRNGISIYFLDAEMSEGRDRATAIGVDADLFRLSEPETLEQAFSLMLSWIETMKGAESPSLVILDSVAALPLEKDSEREFGEEGRRAARASFLSANLPKLIRPLKDSRVGIIFVNQVREKASAAPFEKPTYSPGGRALRHWCHLTLELTRIGQIKEKGEPVGITTRIKIDKSKLGPPFKRTAINLYFDGRVEVAEDED